MDRGVWQARVCGSRKELNMTEQHFHFSMEQYPIGDPPNKHAMQIRNAELPQDLVMI